MDGSIEKPFDSFFEALLQTENDAKTSYIIDITFLFFREGNGNSSTHDVIINEYKKSPGCIAAAALTHEEFPLHFFAHKNATITIK